MTILTSKQRHYKMPDDIRTITVDFHHALDLGSDADPDEIIDPETISSVTVEERGGTGDLLITSAAATALELLILDSITPPGRAAQFHVSGGLRGVTYRIRVTIGTTNGQTISTDLLLQVI